jgi:hypothetical protein
VIKEYLRFSDLDALGSSPAAVRAAFNKIFGAEPDGIALNDETYFAAVRPPITQQYGHFCYKDMGVIQYTRGPTEDHGQTVITTNFAVNRSDQSATIGVSLAGNVSSTTTVSSSVTQGMSFNAGITLEGVFELGMSYNMSVKAGQSSSQQTSSTQTASVEVSVPPRSMKRVEMVGRMKRQTVYFNAPIDVSGVFGANFPDPVNGHYFWFYPTGALLPRTSGEVTGTIHNVSTFDIQTEIGPAEPL